MCLTECDEWLRETCYDLVRGFYLKCVSAISSDFLGFENKFSVLWYNFQRCFENILFDLFLYAIQLFT